MAKKKGGKPATGRAKQRQKTTTTQGARQSRAAYSDDEDAYISFRGFTDATSRRNVPHDPSVKLRHRGIAFISAGTNTPQELEESPPVQAELIAAIQLNDDEDKPEEQESVDMLEDVDTTEAVTSQNAETMPKFSFGLDGAEDCGYSAPAFVIDTVGDPLLEITSYAASRPLPRSVSPASSDSSEEIVFRGRGQIRVVNDPVMHHAPIKQDEPEVIEIPNAWASAPSQYTLSQQAASQEWHPAPAGKWWRNSHPVNDASPVIPSTSVEEDKQDRDAGEVASLQAAWDTLRKEKKQVKKAVQGASSNNRRGRRGRQRDNRLLRSLQDDIEDEEDLAYKDYVENLKQQEEAEKSSGQDTDAEVPDIADMDGMVEENIWKDIFEGSHSTGSLLRGQDSDDSLEDDDDLDSDELEDEINRAERELSLAEDRLTAQRFQSMSDEQLARLWQKQVELGISDDELMIDDGDFGDVKAARDGFAEYAALTQARQKGKRKSKNARDITFPDATALADSIDQYGNEGFDIMDYDRPSLRKTRKGRKGQLPPELDAMSDEELKEDMQAAWENDRAKKRLKKAERERLRAEGLISARSNGKADLKQKYLQGITMEQIRVELAAFLDDEGLTTRSFPPMDKRNRKDLHLIANALNLKSKSMGKGNNRFPVLYKTQRTQEYDAARLDQILEASSRGFFKNHAYKGGRNDSKLPRRSGGGGHAAATLRHGELVGAGAAEIGKENFGHKLMEKMGWTKGMALGKTGEGMLVPIDGVMRVGKAGLG